MTDPEYKLFIGETVNGTLRVRPMTEAEFVSIKDEGADAEAARIKAIIGDLMFEDPDRYDWATLSEVEDRIEEGHWADYMADVMAEAEDRWADDGGAVVPRAHCGLGPGTGGMHRE